MCIAMYITCMAFVGFLCVFVCNQRNVGCTAIIMEFFVFISFILFCTCHAECILESTMFKECLKFWTRCIRS